MRMLSIMATMAYPKVYLITATISIRFMSCLVAQWRNYGFFDKELVKNPEDDQVLDVLKVGIRLSVGLATRSEMMVCISLMQGINITVSCSGRGHMVFGDIRLNVAMLL